MSDTKFHPPVLAGKISYLNTGTVTLGKTFWKSQLEIIEMEISIYFVTATLDFCSTDYPTSGIHRSPVVNVNRKNVLIAIYCIEFILTNIFDFIWPHWCRKSLSITKNNNKPMMMPILVKSWLFSTLPILIFEWSDKFGLSFFPNGFESAMGVGGGFFNGGKTVILNSSSVCRFLTFIGFCVFLWFQN